MPIIKEYKLIRSKRKSISVSVSKDLVVVVKAPLKLPKRDIEAFVAKYADWIEKQSVVMRERNANRVILSDEQIKELKRKAKALLPVRIEHYSAIMGVQPTGIKITSANTRWGSCTAKDCLCFPYKIMLLPSELIDYIVVHELAHIKEKNHSAAFYAVVARYMPDYKDRRKRLKEWSIYGKI